MTRGALATVDAHSQLIISDGRHDVTWLKQHEAVKCVVEVVQRGLVKVWPLGGWAEAEGISSEEAQNLFLGAQPEPLDRGSKASGVFLEVAKRKQQVGRPLHQLRLPDMAVFALFDQGEGPMTVRKGGGGDSGKVLIVVHQEFFELWGQSLL